jgi:hypothetical protein
MKHAPSPADRIDLPAKYFLNQKGVDYCVRSRVPLRDLRGSDGEKSLGFDWPRCRAASLERMVVGNMLSRIELDRSEFISVRSRSEVIGELRARLRENCRGMAAKPGRFDDAEEGSRLCGRLLDAAEGDSMLILSLSPPGSVGHAAETVLVYAGRMGLAEQLAFLLVEFVQIAEKSYFRSMAEHDRYARVHPEELQRLLADPEFRSRLIDAGSRRGDVMALHVSFEGPRGARGAPGDITIALRTKGVIGREQRAETGGKRGKSVRTTDLESLLKSAARDDSYADLSLAYYAGFEQACADEGIAFSSSVVLDEMKNETIATMRIAV